MMTRKIVLEICVESVENAAAAQRAGADRIELCNDLASGGTTPSIGSMETARRQVQIPIYVLIRPRAGDFFYTDHEFEVMRRDVCAAKDCGADGIVVGILDENRNIDVDRTMALVELARPLPVTFHRAFDHCGDKAASLETVFRVGAERILTSGGLAPAIENLDCLASLVRTAGERVVIIPGGGIGVGNVQQIVHYTGAREVHTSARVSSFRSNNRTASSHVTRSCQEQQASGFEQRVLRFRELLDGTISSGS